MLPRITQPLLGDALHDAYALDDETNRQAFTVNVAKTDKNGKQVIVDGHPIMIAKKASKATNRRGKDRMGRPKTAPAYTGRNNAGNIGHYLASRQGAHTSPLTMEQRETLVAYRIQALAECGEVFPTNESHLEILGLQAR